MDLQGLYELHERLCAAAVAGVHLAGEDFRLKRAVEQVRPLAEAVPVIKKLSALAENIMAPGCEDRAGCLLDALALSEAVLCTQAGIGTKEETEPLELTTRQYGPCLPYRQEVPLEKSLTEAGSGRLAVITEAMEQRKEVFEDYRLQAALIAALSDRFADIADAAERFLASGDGGLVPLLKRGFYETSENGRIRRLRVIESLAAGGENAFYLESLQQAKRELREETIHALRFCRENAEVLLGLVHTERGSCLETARQVLGMLDTEETNEYWKQKLAKRPADAVDYLQFSTDDSVSDRIAALIRESFAVPEHEKNKEWNQWVERLLQALPGKASQEMQDVYREAAGGEKTYQPFEQRFVEALTDSVIYCGDERLISLAQELAERSGRVWLAPALAADFLSNPAAEVYERYRDKIQSGFFLDRKREEKRRGRTAVLSVLGRIHYRKDADGHEICCQFAEKTGSPRYSLIGRKVCEAPAREWLDDLKNEKIFGEETAQGPDVEGWFQEKNRDEILFGLLTPEEQQEYGPYFYQRAFQVKDNRKLCELLLRCGWKNFEGVVAAYVRKNSEQGISLWTLREHFRMLPLEEEQWQREIRETDRFLSGFPKGGRERMRWDSSEMERAAVNRAAGKIE